jgi:hypothetical protein
MNTYLNQLATSFWSANNVIVGHAGFIYLGENVVKENEYRSAMANVE